MKNLYILVFVALVSLIGPTPPLAAAERDTIHTCEYIEKISITETDRALRLIDETQALGLMPRCRLDNLRSIVYQNGPNRYRTAIEYSLRAYRNDSIRMYPKELLVTLRLLASQYNNTGNYTESIRYAIEGIELARRTGVKESEAGFLLYVAINKRDMGLKQDAEPYLEQSVRLMEEAAAGSRHWGEVDNLIYVYGMAATFAYEDKEYRKAIGMLSRFRKALEQYKACTDLPDGIYDMRTASIHIMYASIFAASGEMKKAEEYYRLFDTTEYAHTFDGNQMRFEYLVATRRYREALRFIQADKEYLRAESDTLNYEYVERNLRYEAEAYTGLGDHKAAARTYREMYVLSDSLRVREKRNGVLEFAALYETREKEAQLVEQTTRLRESRMTLLFALCVIVLLGVMLWRTVRHIRIVRNKNAALVKTIREQLACKDELFLREAEVRTLQEELRRKGPDGSQGTTREREPLAADAGERRMPSDGTQAAAGESLPQAAGEPPAALPSAAERPASEECTDAVMRDLFARVEYEIVSRRLYLQPDFSKEELKKIVYIPKNRFSRLFKEYAGSSFSQYINNLRMEHAVRLLSEHPNYTVESIAQSCGIASTTTFYRLFSERYDMTPTEFCAGMKRSGNKPVTD